MSGTYKTKQKDIVSACLASRSEKLLSVKEIRAICEGEGTPVGLATIYRQLERLIHAGRVKKIMADDNGGFRFGWLDAKGRQGDFFLKCDRCGKIVHTDCGLLDEMKTHMREEHGFRIDAAKSVLYGRCEDC